MTLLLPRPVETKPSYEQIAIVGGGNSARERAAASQQLNEAIT